VKIAWDKGKRVETKHSEGFTIPLSHNRVMWGDSEDKMTEVPPLHLVVMEKDSKRYAFLVVMQPDDPTNWSKDPKTFTGKVRVLDWEGHPVKGWNVKKGVITGRIFTGTDSGSSRNGRGCVDFSDDVYECVYEGHWDCKKPNPDGVVVYKRTEQRRGSMPCSRVFTENCKKYELDEENLVSAEVTTVCDSQEEADLFGFMTFEQYASSYSYSSGSGPNVNISNNGSVIYIGNNKITIDASVTGCYRELIEKIVNDKTTRDRIIDDFASNFREGGADIKFIQVSEPGKAHAAYNPGPPQLIKINSAYPGSTQEFMTAIILHEMIHALIIMSTNTPVNPEQLEMHRSMFFNWVERTATTMGIYYPNLTREELIAFGLIGLDDYVQTDRETIDSLAKQKYGMTPEEAMSKITPYMTRQKGTTCSY
jgi:hypothetical protein